MQVFDPGSTLVAEDVVVRETGTDVETGRFGAAVSSSADGEFTVRRAFFTDNHDTAVVVDGYGGETALGTLEDTTIRATAPRGNGNAGIGIIVWTAGHFVGTRIVVDDHYETGIFVTNPGTTAVLEDVEIRGVQPNTNNGIMGAGLEVSAEAHVEAHRLRISEASSAGVIGDGVGSELVAEDIQVSGTRPNGMNRLGHGVATQNGAQFDLTRLHISDVYDFALIALGDDSAVRVSGMTIDGVKRSACADIGCPEDYVFGSGVLGMNGRVDLSDFSLEGCPVCGVRVLTGADVDLVDGTIRGNTIGACVEVDGYDLGRLNDNVTYVENESNLNSTSLPVPATTTVSHD
jgi:hypothetical protein